MPYVNIEIRSLKTGGH